MAATFLPLFAKETQVSVTVLLAARFGVPGMPPSRKKIFVLSKRKHFTNKEIAVELNISESTVATQLSLALKFMRDKLMAHYDELLPLVIYAALIKIV